MLQTQHWFDSEVTGGTDMWTNGQYHKPYKMK